MKVSLSGILAKNRIKCRKDMRFMIDEFLRHYEIAQKEFKAGNMETVKQSFELYV